MTPPPTHAADWRALAASFARVAERFVAWCDDQTRPWTLHDAEHALLELLLAGHALVDAEDDDSDASAEDDVTNDEWRTVYERGRELPFDHYHGVLAPHDFERDPTVGTESLSDDLADVYRDVLGGLHAWRAGRLGHAVHEWRHGYEFHWGQHAANALAAMREYAFRGVPD